MDKFNILFSGETLPDHDPRLVRKRFAAYFHIDDPARSEAFFSGKTITLRRNLAKDEAAQVFVALRRIGVITHIERVEPEPSADAAPAPPRRRKRQPGAPNVFDLRLSERARAATEQEKVSSVLATAPMIASGIVMLAFLLVGLRFWAEWLAVPPTGLGAVAIDPREQPVLQVGDKLLRHDRAGVATEDIPLEALGLSANPRFAFFSDGSLLVLQEQAPSPLPAWLQALLGAETQDPGVLLRCKLSTKQCDTVVDNVGEAAFAIDRRTDTIYLADANADQLRKLSAEGELIASRDIALNAPLHLELQEGILYLTQADSDAVLILKPDDRDFGLQLDSVSLQVADASPTGHIYPGDLAWLNGQWWTIMQSRDGSNAGLYLFGPRWKYRDRVGLPENALPQAVVRWGPKMLVSDPAKETLYRFDATARAEKPFASDSMVASLETRESQLGLSRVMQVVILLILLLTSAGLFALGMLQSLRGKVYIPPHDDRELGFDINNELIEWLDPAPELSKRMRLLGYGMAGLAVLLLVVAFLAQASIWTMIAISLLMAGCGAWYFALLKASGCHLGLLEDLLIVVDHTNTYRVGSGPKIQYFNNYVMMDDVIVYLGNPLLSPFDSESLREKYRPLVNTGIKVDRTTLRVKLIQARHPMLIGTISIALACACALLLLLLS